MAEFAEHRFKGATIKGIAEVAGVSTGLWCNTTSVRRRDSGAPAMT